MRHEASSAESGLLEKPRQCAGVVKVEVCYLQDRAELQEGNDAKHTKSKSSSSQSIMSKNGSAFGPDMPG